MWGLQTLEKLNRRNTEAAEIIKQEETPEKRELRTAQFDAEVSAAIQRNADRNSRL